MRWRTARLERLAAAAALLLLCACHGHSPSPSFSLSVSPAALSIPAGGGGFVTVTITRTGGFDEAVTLSLDGAPIGVLGGGSLPATAQTAQVALFVAREVAPQTLESLRVKGSTSTQSRTGSFRLVIAAPLPPGRISPDLVQAGGGLQRGGTLEHTGLAQEPVRAGTAGDAGGVLEVRHGFQPSGRGN